MIKKLLIGIITISTATMVAQRNSASPYSFFGIGENFDALTVEQSSMGGIGVALKDNNHLNFTNPAAIADLRYATYGIGGTLSLITLKDGATSVSGNNTSLRYITLGLPLGKSAGFSVGLQPFSTVGYAIVNLKYDADNEVIEAERFTGSGGTNRIYASFGTYLFKGLSFGAEASFIFGKTENNILNQRRGVLLDTKYQEELNLRGGQFKFGLQYRKALKNDLQLYTGAALTLESNLSASGSQRISTLTVSDLGVENIRSTDGSPITGGSVNLPVKTVFGAGLGKYNKWYVGINQEFKEAIKSSANISTLSNGFVYEGAHKFAIGGFYIPKINSISSYWDRVTYRAGLRFEKVGVKIDGSGTGQNLTSINDFGINVGVGLPLPKQISNVNLGLEYGQKGTTDNNLIKESYFNVKLSFSLNSSNWFRKRKID